MTYFFDTNIVLAYMRASKIANAVTTILDLTDTNKIEISVVTVGELWSIARQSKWGTYKQERLRNLLTNYFQTTVANETLIQRYADIDAFSQNKLLDYPLGDSARNMGKNDLWIAASASLSGATLISTDKDFNHLHGHFLDVIWLDPKKYR